MTNEHFLCPDGMKNECAVVPDAIWEEAQLGIGMKSQEAGNRFHNSD